MSFSVDKPDLRQLRIQAKELLRSVQAGETAALERVLPYFRSSAGFRLANAQTVIARENGFESWAKMAASFEASLSVRFFQALDAGDQAESISLINRHPELAGASRRNEYGWETALHIAARKGYFPVVQALVEAGAEIYAVNPGGYPPVFDAIYERHVEVYEYLFAKSIEKDFGGPPTYGIGIDIVLATRLNLLDTVKMHVERDPLAVYRRGTIGETVLHWPSHNGYDEVVAYLLDHGALIEADEISLYGGKPLHWASEHEPACVRLLLSRGANPMSRNLMPGGFQGFTPLHMMASQPEQCIENAEMLLAAGADAQAIDAKGRTPLNVARENGRERTVAFFEALPTD